MTYGGYAQDEQAFACMKKAYDLGVNFFDTAENYTAGESEVVMGKAIKHFGWKRSDLVISTSKQFFFNHHPIGMLTVSKKSIGALSMERFWSITMVFRGSTSLRAWRLHSPVCN
jgi:aryl-alcohol dehydrogenase-like predicted oxidoreductase